MSFILQTNFERKNFNSELQNESTMTTAAATAAATATAVASIKDEKIVENLRNLVKEYLELVSAILKTFS